MEDLLLIPARPIPINGRGNGKQMAGSAFLVSDNDKVWLVTCVHNVTMMKKTPISAFDPKSSIEVLGTSVAIMGLGKRKLGIVRLNDTPILVDCMSIQLTAVEISALASFGSFLLTEVVALTLNKDVTFSGFPGMMTQPIPASSVQSCVSQIEGISIALNRPAIPGYSGGPLYTDDGLIGVMHGDIGIAPNYTNGLAISLDAVRGALFS